MKKYTIYYILMDNKLINDCLQYSLSSKNIHEIALFILNKVASIIDCTYGFIGEKIITDTKYFRYHAIVGFPEDHVYTKFYIEHHYVDFMHPDTVHSKVLIGESVICHDLIRLQSMPEGILTNFVMYPLLAKDAVIGTLGIGNIVDLNDAKLTLLASLNDLVTNIMIIAFDKRNTDIYKDNFLANISHDIRTPLNSIITCITMLKNTSLTAEQREFINIINQCGMRLLDNANDILDYTKIISGDLKLLLKPMSLKKCVDDVIKLYKPKAVEKNLSLNINYINLVPDIIIGDTTRLTQILLNLLSNAIKFTKTGTVELNIQNNNTDNSKFTLFIQLKDTGIGILDTRIPNLFNTFQQNNNYLCKDNGVGLGLLITKQLIIMHKGKIWIDSVINKGTTVNFTLEYQLYSDNIDKGILQKYYKNTKILILSSDDGDRKLLFEQLTDYGFHTTITYNLLEAEMYLNNKMLKFNYVIVDEIMRSTNILQKIMACTYKAKSVLLFTDNSAAPVDYDLVISKPLNSKKIKYMLDSFYIKQEYITLSPRAAPIKIIIAVNSSTNQLIITNMLNKLEYNNIVTTSDGFELYMELVKNDYDIAFIDLKLPIMDGISAVKKFREHSQKNVLLVAVTEFISNDIRDNCYAAGMHGYITKPINVDELRNMLKIVLCKKNTDV